MRKVKKSQVKKLRIRTGVRAGLVKGFLILLDRQYVPSRSFSGGSSQSEKADGTD